MSISRKLEYSRTYKYSCSLYCSEFFTFQLLGNLGKLTNVGEINNCFKVLFFPFVRNWAPIGLHLCLLLNNFWNPVGTYSFEILLGFSKFTENSASYYLMVYFNWYCIKKMFKIMKLGRIYSHKISDKNVKWNLVFFFFAYIFFLYNKWY